MADKQIIFSGPMVRALLDGRKTQTRRLLKVEHDRPHTPLPDAKTFSAWHDGPDLFFHEWFHDTGAMSYAKVPISVGDRLYVREAHYLTDDGENEYAVFAAEQQHVDEHLANMQATMASHPNIDWSKHLRLRPAIHMPRWASRLTLTVTDVRVQRLQDTSEADAVAEGAMALPPFMVDAGGATCKLQNLTHKNGFRDLWNSINGPEAWDANPWIYALTFTVQRGNIDEVKV